MPDQIDILNSEYFLKHLLPLFESRVEAGFPSPADDFIESNVNLKDQLVKNPEATFLVRVKGESMIDANMYDGDVLVVDRSALVSNGKIIVAVVDGAFTVKRFSQENGKISLLPENKAFPVIEIVEGMEFLVWGVVTYIIHKAQ